MVQKEEIRSSKLDNLVKILQTRLTSLSLLYFGIVRTESALCTRRLSYEKRLLDQLASRNALSERLCLLSLHIQHETRGSVVVKKLAATHPQYLRCQRAACENVKKDFFSNMAGDGDVSSSKYDGVEVEAVWKIENRILLDTFQSSASQSDPGKVKGLFCGVPNDCLETLIVYGMKGRPSEKGVKGKGDGTSAFQVRRSGATRTTRERSEANVEQIEREERTPANVQCTTHHPHLPAACFAFARREQTERTVLRLQEGERGDDWDDEWGLLKARTQGEL